MKIIVFFLTIFGVCIASEIKTFEEFKTHFNKHYNSIEEEHEAKHNFERSLRWIEENQNKHGHKLGLTSVADMPDENDYFEDDSPLLKAPYFNPDDENAILPDAFDWRDHIDLHEVQTQGKCGSCWAFSCALCIEARLAITQNIAVHVSEQELLDCVKKINPRSGCRGGPIAVAFRYAIEFGLHDASVYPYHFVEGVCRSNIPSPKYYLKSQEQLPNGSPDKIIMANLFKYGPMVLIIDSHNHEFKLYK